MKLKNKNLKLILQVRSVVKDFIKKKKNKLLKALIGFGAPFADLWISKKKSGKKVDSDSDLNIGIILISNGKKRNLEHALILKKIAIEVFYEKKKNSFIGQNMLLCQKPNYIQFL